MRRNVKGDCSKRVYGNAVCVFCLSFRLDRNLSEDFTERFPVPACRQADASLAGMTALSVK